eukprot:TRINITY_DN760_c0_g4_i1.p1 TRINITY_DN760_c0_g4~~TRINITY_DN760_c0_g4_i1.p1  ORF type:complete len:391 (-),score=76.65 TRINITY_DN760_c0_g4_i1:48-1220(-)
MSQIELFEKLSSSPFYFPVACTGTIIFGIYTVFNSIAVVKLFMMRHDKSLRMPLITCMLNQMPCGAQFAFFALQIVQLYNSKFTWHTFSYIGSGLLILGVLGYLGMLLYVMFQWIKIVIMRTNAVSQEAVKRYKKLAFIFVTMWTIAWLCAWFISRGRNTAAFHTSLAMFSLIPVLFSIGFIIFGWKLRKMVLALQQDDLKNHVHFKLTVLSVIFILAMDMIALFTIFSTALDEADDQVIFFATLFLPTVVVCGATLWAFHPFQSRIAVKGAASTGGSGSGSGTGSSKGTRGGGRGRGELCSIAVQANNDDDDKGKEEGAVVSSLTLIVSLSSSSLSSSSSSTRDGSAETSSVTTGYTPPTTTNNNTENNAIMNHSTTTPGEDITTPNHS